MEGSHLKHLRLPRRIKATSAWLKDLAAKHPRIEHLALSTQCCSNVTSDACDNPFEGFANLTSLSLSLVECFSECTCCDDPPPLGAILDRLPLHSLELSGASQRDEETWERGGPELQIPSPITTPNLIKSLVHLRIEDDVEFRHVEYLLYHCRRLETLRLDEVGYAMGRDHNAVFEEFPPMIESHHQLSPFLRSATLGFGWVTEVY